MKIDVRKMVKDNITMNVEVRIVNARSVKIRLWIAVQLVKLAAWIGGYGLKITQQIGVIVEDKYIQ